MTIIRTLSCIRPRPDLAAQIASGPHSAMTSEEIRQKIEKNPLSYTRIVHPRFLYMERLRNADEIYIKAAENLEQWVKDGIMIDDREDSFYLYEMDYQCKTQTGIVVRIPIDEILNQTVKAHEKVRENKLCDLAHHIELCRAQIGGPILMTYRYSAALETWKKENKEKEEALYHFLSENNVQTRIWKIADQEQCEAAVRMFEDVASMYIADGHHRIMSAVKICEDMRRKYPDYTGEEAWNYVTCVCFPDSELNILPYSRMVNEWKNDSLQTICEKLKKHFEVFPLDQVHFPEHPGEYVMLAEKKAYLLRFRESFRPESVPESLDVSVLQKYVLEPLFHIRNDKRNSRLEFMGGEEQLAKVMDRCYYGSGLGFLMYPPRMEEILQVADRSMTMPPKSTWFSPKMCNGLFIYRIFLSENQKGIHRG